MNEVTPAFVGICGSDLHEYIGGAQFCPTHPHPLTGAKIPVTLGHEFSGTIKELGAGVENLKVGQKCAVQPLIFCRECPACKAGAYNICHKIGFVGVSDHGGGLSDAVCVRADRVFPLPESLPLDIGALVEPLSVAWHAMSAAPDVAPDSFVLIVGGGPIGLAIVLCLRAKGVENIMVSEVAAARQNFAKDFGAKWVINPMEVDAVAEVMEKTGGKGADVTFDCAGVPARYVLAKKRPSVLVQVEFPLVDALSVKCVCSAVKTMGRVVNVAIWEKNIPFNPNWLTFKESSYTAVLAYRDKDFAAVIENLSTGRPSSALSKMHADGTGAISPKNMITSKIRLDDIVKGGFEKLITDKENQVKILVDLSLQ